MPKGVGLSAFCSGRLFHGIWFSTGVKGRSTIGLGKGIGLPLLKGWLWDKDHRKSHLKGLALLC